MHSNSLFIIKSLEVGRPTLREFLEGSSAELVMKLHILFSFEKKGPKRLSVVEQSYNLKRKRK